MTGTDLSLLNKEVKKAREVLKKIRELRAGASVDQSYSMGDRVGRTLSLLLVCSLKQVCEVFGPLAYQVAN